MDKLKILGIVPARAGSQRVKGKNFKPFAGTTLSDLAIQQALESKLLDKVVVNSDSKEVLEIASAYPEVVALERPAALAGNESPAIDYMIHTLDHFEEIGENYDLVVIIQPSSPLRGGEDIDRTIERILADPGSTSSVSVVKVSHMLHPHKLKTLEEGVLEPWLVDEGQKTSAHELPDIYVRNCAVYVFRSSLLRNGTTYGDRCLAYEMPEDMSVDINDPVEFEFAEYLYLKKKKS